MRKIFLLILIVFFFITKLYIASSFVSDTKNFDKKYIQISNQILWNLDEKCEEKSALKCAPIDKNPICKSALNVENQSLKLILKKNHYNFSYNYNDLNQFLLYFSLNINSPPDIYKKIHLKTDYKNFIWIIRSNI